MDLLIKKRAPLKLYDDIYQWHTNHLKATDFKPRKTLLSELKKRYNMADKGPKLIKDMVLPHSQSRIDLVVHYFEQEVQSLLSDPRWTDDDYLFHNETDGLDENGKIKRKFYLVDVEAFHGPTIVIPDLGNENPAALLRLVPRSEWSDQFVTWLGSEHTREFD